MATWTDADGDAVACVLVLIRFNRKKARTFGFGLEDGGRNTELTQGRKFTEATSSPVPPAPPSH